MRISRRRSLPFIAAMTIATALAATAAGAAEPYLLGPQDKLRIQVFEWRRSQDKIIKWEGLNDEFTVSAEGTVSLPLVGEVIAVDQPASAVAREIAAKLQQRMNLITPPDTSVEVSQYRPIYVVGDVMKPGAFPFRPGMIVIQAISLAEGLLRTPNQVREMVTEQGNREEIALRREALMARKARLESEAAGSSTIAFPAQLGERTGPTITTLMEQETLIFKTRAEAFRAQTEALQELRAYLVEEITSLEAQIAAQTTQTDLLNKELEGIYSLVAKGLAVAPRQYALERSKAEIQGDHLRLESTMMRARQEISKADLSLLELRNKRDGDIAIEIRLADQELRELENKARVTQGLLRQIFPLSLENGRPKPAFMVLRSGLPGGEAVAVRDNDVVLPGDTIVVSLPELDYQPTGGSNGDLASSDPSHTSTAVSSAN